MLVTCSTCKKSNNQSAKFCGYCGAQITVENSKKTNPNRRRVIFISIVAAIILLSISSILYWNISKIEDTPYQLVDPQFRPSHSLENPNNGNGSEYKPSNSQDGIQPNGRVIPLDNPTIGAERLEFGFGVQNFEELRYTLEQYYFTISEGIFKPTEFFHHKGVDRYYQRENLTLNDLKEEYQSFKKEFLWPKYDIDYKSIGLWKKGNNYIVEYTGRFNCIRRSKERFQSATNRVFMIIELESFRITALYETDLEYEFVNKAPDGYQYGAPIEEMQFPEVSSTRLTQEKLSKYSKKELRLMRNEVFARYGYVFKSEDMGQYFHNQRWYRIMAKLGPDDNAEKYISEIEKFNINIIKKAERTVDQFNRCEVSLNSFDPKYLKWQPSELNKRVLDWLEIQGDTEL